MATEKVTTYLCVHDADGGLFASIKLSKEQWKSLREQGMLASALTEDADGSTSRWLDVKIGL